LLSAESVASGRWRKHKKGTVTLTCKNIMKNSDGPKAGVDCRNEASPANRLHIAVAGHPFRSGRPIEYYWGVQGRYGSGGWEYYGESEYLHRNWSPSGTLKNVDMTQKIPAYPDPRGRFLYKGGNVVRWRAPNGPWFRQDVRVCVVAVRTGTQRTQTSEGCYLVRVAREILDATG
jgi:hypothetical protein